MVVAGELFSPLKALHLFAGPVNATYLITDEGARVRELLALHEAAQLDLVRQMAAAGVPAMMAMDNLDTAFHPPAYVERFSVSNFPTAKAVQWVASIWRRAGSEAERSAAADAILKLAPRVTMDDSIVRAAKDLRAKLKVTRAAPEWRPAVTPNTGQAAGSQPHRPFYAHRWINSCARIWIWSIAIGFGLA